MGVARFLNLVEFYGMNMHSQICRQFAYLQDKNISSAKYWNVANKASESLAIFVYFINILIPKALPAYSALELL